MVKKLSILIFFIAVGLGVAYYKSTLQTKEVLGLSVLDGYVSYAEQPEISYESTKIEGAASELEPDWYPKGVGEVTGGPAISGESALVVDLDTGQVLFEKNPSEQKQIASITKVMTALVALEHAKLDKTIYITRHSAYVGENSMYLTVGEIYSLQELLYGMLLLSGNDAAYAIADGVGGYSDTFVNWMNFKARELGLKDTKFADPSGLDDNTLSTSVDLVKLARYLLKNEEFAQIVGTSRKELLSDTHKHLYLENETNLVGSYPGVAGIKTGYTEEAGLCLLTYAENGGHRLVGVVLDSQDRRGDMILMLDYGFELLGVAVEHELL